MDRLAKEAQQICHRLVGIHGTHEEWETLREEQKRASWYTPPQELLGYISSDDEEGVYAWNGRAVEAPTILALEVFVDFLISDTAKGQWRQTWKPQIRHAGRLLPGSLPSSQADPSTLGPGLSWEVSFMLVRWVPSALANDSWAHAACKMEALASHLARLRSLASHPSRLCGLASHL